MPIYEYQCKACGHKLEIMQRMSEDPLKTCPSCAADALSKLISKAGFRLTGTGWYETDFKDKGKPEADKDGAGDKESVKESKKDDGKKDESADTKKSDSAESSKASTPTPDK